MQLPDDNLVKSLAIIIPAYNESESLPALIDSLLNLIEGQKQLAVRVVFVDDHSDDSTPEILRKMAKRHDWLRYLRLARRSGSHVAIIAGLNECNEDAAVFMAADLQDPPELVVQMLNRLNSGHDVVWAVRENDDNQPVLGAAASKLFHKLFRYMSDIEALPYQPAFALMTRRAYAGLVECFGAHSSFLTEIPRLGYPTAEVSYRKPTRKFGKSKWGLGRKITAFWDAIVTSSHMPMRLMSVLGLVLVFLGFAYAILLLTIHVAGTSPVQGWASLMVVMLVLGGFQITMMGVIGEYVARTKENTRRGPLFFIEDRYGFSVSREE